MLIITQTATTLSKIKNNLQIIARMFHISRSIPQLN